LHRNLECQVHESRQIGSGQTRDGKSDKIGTLCPTGRNVKEYSHYGNSMAVYQKIKNRITI